MKKFIAFFCMVMSMIVSCSAFGADKIAIQIVFDNSGSMADSIPNSSASKFESGKQALIKIADQIDNFINRNPGVEVYVGVLTFGKGRDSDNRSYVVKPLHPYNRKTFDLAVESIPSPGGNTPLGETIDTAYSRFMNGSDVKRHIFVITDGQQNGKIRMEDVIAKNNGYSGIYFVAFDVNAKVFDASKEQGAFITQADDTAQLFTQVFEIFNSKILLEKEE